MLKVHLFGKITSLPPWLPRTGWNILTHCEQRRRKKALPTLSSLVQPLKQPSTLCLPSLGSARGWKLTGSEESGALQRLFVVAWYEDIVNGYGTWLVLRQTRSGAGAGGHRSWGYTWWWWWGEGSSNKKNGCSVMLTSNSVSLVIKARCVTGRFCLAWKFWSEVTFLHQVFQTIRFSQPV